MIFSQIDAYMHIHGNHNLILLRKYVVFKRALQDCVMNITFPYLILKVERVFFVSSRPRECHCCSFLSNSLTRFAIPWWMMSFSWMLTCRRNRTISIHLLRPADENGRLIGGHKALLQNLLRTTDCHGNTEPSDRIVISNRAENDMIPVIPVHGHKRLEGSLKRKSTSSSCLKKNRIMQILIIELIRGVRPGHFTYICSVDFNCTTDLSVISWVRLLQMRPLKLVYSSNMTLF